ncbi:MAG TPA: hypothetical protein VIW78_00495, partial [Burkholderiales bacterium]
MNRRSILTKTGKGLMEATGKTSNLSRDLRNILKEIDGKVSVSELLEKGKLTEAKLLEGLTYMEKEGYVREFVGKQEEAPRAPVGRGSISQSPADGGEDLDFTSFTPAPMKPAAKVNEDGRLQTQAQEIARQARATRAREEAVAKARAEAAARARAEAEQKARLAAQASPRLDANARAQAEALDQARREADERQRREAEEKARREAEARARIDAEQAPKREAEERIRREIQEKERRENEEKARREAEVRSRLEAEDKVRRDAEERVRREAEERARKVVEERMRREEIERRVREEEERVRREAEERERRKREEREQVERKVRIEAEARAKVEAEMRARRESEERAQREEGERARREEQLRRRAQDEARERREAEEREGLELSLRVQEEKARSEAEDREREEERRREEEERARREAEEEVQRAEEEEELAKEEERQARDEERTQAKGAAQTRKTVRAKERAGEESWRGDEETARDSGEASLSARELWAQRKPRSLAKQFAMMLLVILIVGIAALPFVPLEPGPYEKAAQAWLGEPVKIGTVNLTLLPLPQLKFEKVAIGKEPQMRVAAIRATPEITSLLEDRISLKNLELENVTFPREFLRVLLQDKGGRRSLGVQRISAKGLKLDIPELNLPALELNATLSSDGALQSVTLYGAEPKLSVKLQPQGGRAGIEISADNFPLPLGMDLAFSDFLAKGTVTGNEIALSEAEARAFGGRLLGNARLRWSDGWSLEGELAVRQMEAGKIAAPLLAGGELGGKGTYSMKALLP